MPSIRRLPAVLLLAALAACGQDASGPVAPEAQPAPGATPSFLLAPGEGVRTISDTTDAAGNQVVVAEYAAGVYYQPDGEMASVASVVIKTVIPTLPSGSSKEPCITSTVQAVETTPGWTSKIKKSGGCDEEIVVELSNRSTDQQARFRFLMIFGKTRIDSGLVR
jgi:hypothetical protein